MLIHATVPAWYNRSGWKCYLNTRLWPEDKESYQIELNGNIRFVLTEKACIGYSRNYPRYAYNPCTEKSKNVVQCAICRSKNLSHVCERCKGKVCEIPELNYYCKNPHALYIAFFSHTEVNVGVSSIKNFENRIIEQGPFMVLKLFEVQDKFIARKFEDQLSVFLEIPERVSSSNKEKILLSEFRSEELVSKLVVLQKKLIEFSKETQIKINVDNVIYMSKFYNFDFLGKKLYPLTYTKKSLIEGKIVSNLGSLSILNYDENYYVLNLNKLKGWILDTEAKGFTQSRLF